MKAFSANVLNGLARFLYAFKDSIKDELFKEKLGEVSIKELSKTAKERRAGSLGYAEAMLLYYNKRMRSSLQWNTLYSNRIENCRKKSKTTEQAAALSVISDASATLPEDQTRCAIC